MTTGNGASDLSVAERDSETMAVELRGVHKTFGSVQAVRGIDLTMRSGEVVAFLGPNGAGKTSTIDIILGLSRPTAGEVAIFGMAPRRAVTKGLISAVMQTGGLLKDLTVRETVQYTSNLFAVSRPVEEVLKRAGITRHCGSPGGKVFRRGTAAPPLCHGTDTRSGAPPPR